MQNQKVYEKAIDLLEKYFALEEQEDIMEMLQQPSQNMNTNESTSLWGNASTAEPTQ